MDNTLERIQRTSNERQILWRKAAQGGLSPSESNRIQTITEELANLWDNYRRELAGLSKAKGRSAA
jgi:hypothetical protein